MPTTAKLKNNLYHVQNQWGGNSAPWHEGGLWVIGGRSGQPVIQLNVTSSDGGRTLVGTMTYQGEGPIGFKAALTNTNNTYVVENQWGGDDAPWHPGGMWLIGCRNNQNVVAIDISSDDNGRTLNGTMTYANEGPIGFKSEAVDGGVYDVENQWGGDSAPWHPGGIWVMGCRGNQTIVALQVSSDDGGQNLQGTNTYNNEGPIGFKGPIVVSNTYNIENQWGGDSAPWHPGGLWVMGCRSGQNVVAVDISSSNGGNNLNGTMTYVGEGPIGFRAKLR